MSAKKDFIEEASKIEVKDVKYLIEYLEETDFFTAPASTVFHGSHEGGLVIHSLTVYDIMKELNETLDLNLPQTSIAISGLFHDVCKVNMYVVDDREASPAQIKYAQDLCEQNKEEMPIRSERTSKYLSSFIDALVSKKPIPQFKPSYKVVDTLPMGHGEKSVFIINKFMPLTDEEALAIRWHLGGYDPGVSFSYPSGMPQKQAFRENKLVALLATADIATSYLVDVW